MSDTASIVLTACTTLAGGVILLIITELLKVLVATPVQKMREQMQTALSQVDFHSNRLTNFFSAEPSEYEMDIIKEITKGLREAATNLKSSYLVIPMRNLLSALNIIPNEERIETACSGLIYLHNSILFEGKRSYIVNLIEMNENRIDRVRAALTNNKIPDLLGPEQYKRP